MKTVPPSHFPSSSPKLQNAVATAEAATQFQLAMEHVHNVSSSLVGGAPSPVNATVNSNTQQFIIQGGCPFKSFHSEHDRSNTTLIRAMEDYSLAAIMGRMAESFSDDESDAGEDQAEEEATESLSQSLKRVSSEIQQGTDSTISGDKPARSSLSEALKSGTAESHTAAENVHFVKNFIRGIIDRELYVELVTGLYHTYVTLEKLLDIHGPTHFPTLYFPKELSRTEALREDMEFWHGNDWEKKPECRTPTPAVQDYLDRMEEVGRIDPLLLLSHAYTRYLGDLSGGKVLSRIARRALNLSGYDGLQFYQFESITSAKLFKDQYRAALDDLTLQPDQIGRLVAEANVAFALNMRVFEELDVAGGIPGARVRDVREALVYYDREIELQKKGTVKNSINEPEAKCPFGFTGPNPHELMGSNSSSAKNQVKAEVGTKLAVKKETSEGRCPWPFVFFHDVNTGMKDWQTWFVIGLVLCWCWANVKVDLLN